MISYRWRDDFHDEELNRLHTNGFGGRNPVAWNERVRKWSLGWVCARQDLTLIGFVNVISDGGSHAILLDTVVETGRQRQGVGKRLVAEAVRGAYERGCEWMHVDYEAQLSGFYRDACGFKPTEAGLIRLDETPPSVRTG